MLTHVSRPLGRSNQVALWRRLILLVLVALISTACARQPTAEPQVEPAPSPTSQAVEQAPSPPEAPADESITLVDGVGRQVTLPGPAKRIVSLAPSNTEIIFAIGAGAQLIGRDDLSDYPPEAQAVTSIGSTYGQLNSEAILALEPDLVLAADITAPEQVQTLESLGVPLFLLPNPADFEGLFDNLETVGRLTGHLDQAEALVEDLRARVEAVTDKVASADPVRVFYEVDGTDPTAPWTTGAGTFQDVLIDLAGGENIASDLQGWGQMNLETIVARDPQVIIFGAGPWVPTTAESLAARTGWDIISAVQTGRVHGIDTNQVDRPGPRLVDALEQIAIFLHPELFGEEIS